MIIFMKIQRLVGNTKPSMFPLKLQKLKTLRLKPVQISFRNRTLPNLSGDMPNHKIPHKK